MNTQSFASKLQQAKAAAKAFAAQTAVIARPTIVGLKQSTQELGNTVPDVKTHVTALEQATMQNIRVASLLGQAVFSSLKAKIHAATAPKTGVTTIIDVK